MPEVSIVKCKEISKSDIIEQALPKAISLIGGLNSKVDNEGATYIPGCPSHMDIIRDALKRKAGHYW